MQYKELELSNYKAPDEVSAILRKAEDQVKILVAQTFTFLPPHVIELSENGYIGKQTSNYICYGLVACFC